MMKFENGEMVELDVATLHMTAGEFAGHEDAIEAAAGFNRIVDALIGKAEQAEAAEINFDGARLESAVRSAYAAFGSDHALSEMTDDQARALAERVF